MAGCECGDFQEAVKREEVYADNEDWWKVGLGGVGFNLRIWNFNRCPYCAADLTLPEDTDE